MTTRVQLEVRAGMQRVCRRFEAWRSSHQGRLPILERSWAAAAMAREHGFFRTAKVLRLEYGKLKLIAEAGDRSPQLPTPTAFSELCPRESLRRIA